jgi:hypothetical protein
MSKFSFGVSNETFPDSTLPFHRPRKILSIDMPDIELSPNEEIDPNWLPKYLASQVRMDLPGLVDDIAQAKVQMIPKGDS